jgi:hypothetical protein
MPAIKIDGEAQRKGKKEKSPGDWYRCRAFFGFYHA